MSPIWEDENTTREKLLELRQKNKCKVCGGMLNVFMDFDADKVFLACNDWRRTHHEGIEREARQFEPNIPTRRAIMENDLGAEQTKALEKYYGVVSLTKWQAKEILQAVYPNAPPAEMARAVLLCASYQLNPLMKHVFLIKFNKWDKDHKKIIGEDWATVLGIKAKRLLASRPDRRGQARPYSYVDNTPRVMTEAEQKTIFGQAYDDRLWVITKVKDPQTGAEAVGYGFWLHKDTVYGAEKGNTAFNMAAVRSESQGLDRLRPGEMPVGIEVMPEDLAEAKVKGDVIDVEATILPDEKVEELEPSQTQTTPPSAESEALEPKDETPVTPEQIKELDTLMGQAGMDNTALGIFCNKDMGWGIQKKPDLKKWQLDLIVTKILKGLEG